MGLLLHLQLQLLITL